MGAGIAGPQFCRYLAILTRGLHFSSQVELPLRNVGAPT